MTRGKPAYDHLHKFRPLLPHLNTTWKTAYHPNCEISVDESVVAFKGSTNQSAYKPNGKFIVSGTLVYRVFSAVID